VTHTHTHTHTHTAAGLDRDYKINVLGLWQWATAAGADIVDCRGFAPAPASAAGVCLPGKHGSPGGARLS
jgi:hypothetical protein